MESIPEDILINFTKACGMGDITYIKFVCDMYTNYKLTRRQFNDIVHACIYNFSELPDNDNMELILYVLNKQPSLIKDLEYERQFMNAASCGVMSIAQFIYKEFQPLDVCMNKDWSFKNACKNGHLESVQWLEELRPDRYEITEVITDENGNTYIQYKIYKNNDRSIYQLK